jgi:site-specific recombinase XerD
MKETFDSQIRNLALTLRPGSVAAYRVASRRFLNYLAAYYPKIHHPFQLRRDPHILGYMRILCEKKPPLKNSTRSQYLIYLRHLLLTLVPGRNLLATTDFPRIDTYLPRSLSPENDQLLDQELRKNPDIIHNALLLLRATGMRIGECVSLGTDCLRHVGDDEWAIHVPLGKLHSERWIPVDSETRKIIARIPSLRSSFESATSKSLPTLLFPWPYTHLYRCEILRRALAAAAQRAGCSTHVSPHQLRHTFATSMLRAGMSLPALKEILGHRSIRMTMRYITVTQIDLQQQYHEAHRKITTLHAIPKLPLAHQHLSNTLEDDLTAIRNLLVNTRHLMEMYRRRCIHGSTDKKLNRFMNRVSAILEAMSDLESAPK